MDRTRILSCTSKSELREGETQQHPPSLLSVFFGRQRPISPQRKKRRSDLPLERFRDKSASEGGDGTQQRASRRSRINCRKAEERKKRQSLTECAPSDIVSRQGVCDTLRISPNISSKHLSQSQHWHKWASISATERGYVRTRPSPSILANGEKCHNSGGFRNRRRKNVNREFPSGRNFDGSIRAILTHFAINCARFWAFGQHSAKMTFHSCKHLAFAPSFELISILIH